MSDSPSVKYFYLFVIKFITINCIIVSKEEEEDTGDPPCTCRSFNPSWYTKSRHAKLMPFGLIMVLVVD